MATTSSIESAKAAEAAGSGDAAGPAGLAVAGQAKARARAVAWPAWEVVALAAVTGLGLVLRVSSYAQAPPFLDNADELNWAWGGLNLILRHDAYTWSYFSAYPMHTTISAYGTTFPMVHHWLDHPPLFSLVVGGWLWLLGVRDMLAVTPEQVRVLPVAFSTLTIPLSYLVGRRALGRLPALCGVALLATAPGAVLLGRVTEAESLLAVLLLAAALACARIVDGPAGRRWALLLLGCCVVAPLLKVPGLAVAGICAVVLAAAGRWRLAAAAAAAGTLALHLFALYGALVDWPLFLSVQAEQASRRTGMMAGLAFIADPSGVNRRLEDGWWLLGWLGLAVIAARGRRPAPLLVAWPAIAYAAVMMLVAGETEVGQYGWYRIIVYPEVYLAAGWLAWEAVSRRSPALVMALLVLGGATATNWWLGGPTASWVPSPVLFCVLVAVVVGPTILATWRGGDPLVQRAAMAVAGATLAVLVLGNAIESLRLDLIYARL